MFRRLHKTRDEFKEHTDLETFKHFQIIRKAGSGTYSTVYEVERNDDHRRYALKATDVSRLTLEENLGMVEEIRLLASLRHPNVLKYYEAFVDENYLCIVTELVHDGDVLGLLNRCREEKRTLPEYSVWSILIQSLAALDYLHSGRLLHRDIKPGNLLLCGRRVLLADFGVSRLLDHVFTRTQLGTPGYMSPEMWRGEPYSLSSDIWALGCVAFELCTLSQLFEGQSEEEIKQKVLSGGGFFLPTSYSDDLYLFISHMLDPDPISRYTARELMESASVTARLSLLPPDVRTALSAGANSMAPTILKPIAVPRNLRDLNKVLPPARYTHGRAVAGYLTPPGPGGLSHISEIDEELGGFHEDLAPIGAAVQPIPARSLPRHSVANLTFNRQVTSNEDDMKALGRLKSSPNGAGYRGTAPIERSSVSVAIVSEMRKQGRDNHGMHAPRDTAGGTQRRMAAMVEGDDTEQFDGIMPFELCPISRTSFIMPSSAAMAFRPRTLDDLPRVTGRSPPRPKSHEPISSAGQVPRGKPTSYSASGLASKSSAGSSGGLATKHSSSDGLQGGKQGSGSSMGSLEHTYSAPIRVVHPAAPVLTSQASMPAKLAPEKKPKKSKIWSKLLSKAL